MTYERTDRVLQASVVIATLLTALCPLYFAYYLVHLYVTHGQPLFAGLRMASSTLRYTGWYVCAALFYATVPRLRNVLRAVACAAAAHAVWQAPTYWSFVEPKNYFHNLLAEAVWELYGLLLVALLCIAHLTVELLHRRSLRAL